MAQLQGYTIPDTLLFRAGLVFYHEGRVSEVRLAGLVSGRPDTAGQLTFTRWSTPISPTVTEGSQGELVLHAAGHGRSHFSALVPARTMTSPKLVACLWDLRAPTLGEWVAEASSTPSQLPLLRDEHFTVLSPAHYQAVCEVITHNTFPPPAWQRARVSWSGHQVSDGAWGRALALWAPPGHAPCACAGCWGAPQRQPHARAARRAPRGFCLYGPRADGPPGAGLVRGTRAYGRHLRGNACPAARF